MLISQLAASCDESNHGEVLVNANSYYSTTSWNVNTCGMAVQGFCKVFSSTLLKVPYSESRLGVRWAPNRSFEAPQRGQKGFKFLAAIVTALQVVLHQGHRFSGVLAGQFHLDEAVQLLETFVAPDLVRAGGDDFTCHLLERIQVKCQ
jgi:hypothetical protein